MHLVDLQQHAARYILERLCPSGGYCYYRLDEPNPHDTYYALATLHLLRIPSGEERTVGYLRAMQQADGTYASLIQAFFVLLSLKYLDGEPLHDPAAGLRGFADSLLSGPAASGAIRPSLLHELYQLTALYAALALPWPEEQRHVMLRLVQASRRPDGGYGTESATLSATFHAAAVLRRLGHPLASEQVAPYLRACEHPVSGFTGKPGTSLCFLEYVYAGLALCAELSLAPTHSEACAAFLRQCQTNAGGFARAPLAAATLENTYFAIRGLDVLTRMQHLG